MARPLPVDERWDWICDIKSNLKPRVMFELAEHRPINGKLFLKVDFKKIKTQHSVNGVTYQRRKTLFEKCSI